MCVQFARMRVVMSEPKPRGKQNLHDYVILLRGGRVLKSGCTLRSESAAARWDCAFESHQGHGVSSLVSVVCCQVEICNSPITCPVESYNVCGMYN